MLKPFTINFSIVSCSVIKVSVKKAFFYIFLTLIIFRVGNDVSEWFPVNVGLREGCVMSPWLLNVYIDGVVREVNVRVLGKGLELLSVNGGRFEINQCYLQMIQH